MPTKPVGRRYKKAPKLEKCEGFKLVQTARELKKKGKKRAAVAAYVKGIASLEKNLRTIDNAAEKRKFKDELEAIRHEKLQLENEALKKSPRKMSASKSAAAVKKKSPRMTPLEDETGFAHIFEARKLEAAGRLKPALELYTKGITSLMATIPAIDRKSDKDKRHAEIKALEHSKHRLAMRIAEESRDIRVHEVKREEATPFEKVAGYSDCVRADRFFKDGKLESAEKYYARAIPQLEAHLVKVDNTREKKRRSERIAEWRHSLQKIRNMKIRGEEVVELRHAASPPPPGDADRSTTTIMDSLIQDPPKRKKHSRRTSLTLALKSTSLADSGGMFSSFGTSLPPSLESGSASSSRRSSGGDGPVEKHFLADSSDRFTIKMLKTQDSKGRLPMFGESMSSPTPGGMVKVRDITPAMFTTVIPGGSELFGHIRHGFLNLKTIEESTARDFFDMLHLVVFSIFKVPLPFLVSVREPLYKALLNKIESHDGLEQAFRAFLYSHIDVPLISGIFRDHIAFPQTVSKSKLTDLALHGGTRPKPNVGDMSPVSDMSDFKMEFPASFEDKSSEFPGIVEFESHYKDRDQIWFFRTLLERDPDVGYTVEVDHDLVVYDPMGSMRRIHRVEVVRKFVSHARPILLAMYSKQKESDRDPSKVVDVADVKKKGKRARMKALKQRSVEIGDDDMLTAIAEEEMHASAPSPMLLVSRCILKRGDDLRKDRGALDMLRFMNSVWQDCNLYYHGYPVQTRVYRVLPMGDDFGAMEFIEDCRALKDLMVYKDVFRAEHLRNLVATAAASYVAAYVIGVRDRHWDNVLVRNDGTLFHIDFGFIMGDTLGIDTAKVAITKDLYKLLGGGSKGGKATTGGGDEEDSDEEESEESSEIESEDDAKASSGRMDAEDSPTLKETTYWEDFVELSVDAFMTLRSHFNELAEYGQITFACTQLKEEPEIFLARRLQMDATKDEDYVQKKMTKKFADAPFALSTKIKNTVHGIATSMMGTEESVV